MYVYVGAGISVGIGIGDSIWIVNKYNTVEAHQYYSPGINRTRNAYVLANSSSSSTNSLSSVSFFQALPFVFIFICVFAGHSTRVVLLTLHNNAVEILREIRILRGSHGPRRKAESEPCWGIPPHLFHCGHAYQGIASGPKLESLKQN